MEEHHLESEPRVAPERAVRAKTDVAVLVVVEIEKLLREIAVARARRSARHHARLLDHIVEPERGSPKHARRKQHAQRQSKRLRETRHRGSLEMRLSLRYAPPW